LTPLTALDTMPTFPEQFVIIRRAAMRRKALLVALILVLPALLVALVVKSIVRVSVDSAGAEGNGTSGNPRRAERHERRHGRLRARPADENDDARERR
jgi:hypothetical protein